MAFEVYIHVPFCKRRCGYCDFNTYTAARFGAILSRDTYAAMAIGEMRLVREWQEAHGICEPAAQSVYIGGGTPTILPPADLILMLNAVRDLWGIEPGAEITTEANPDTVTEDAIAALADGGFTRISFGMQSAVPHVLKTLDRTHTPENVASGVAAARACGLETSVDLIYGAPGETLDDWRRSLRAAIQLDTNHISAYALTIAPRTPMGRRIAAGTLPRPNDDDEAAKYEIADAMLANAGLEWYEISNWARPGHESRHNLGYWRNIDWAGIGPGAHSHYRLANESGDTTFDAHENKTPAPADRERAALADGGEAFRRAGDPDGLDQAEDAARDAGNVGLRAWDIAHPKTWAQTIQSNHIPWAGAEGIGRAQDAEESLMLGLRLKEGLDTARFPQIPNSVWDELHSEGLIDVAPDDCRAVPTLRGRLLNDTVILRLMDWL